MRRSLLFNVSTSLEDQDVTGERQETAHLSEGHISAELQLRNECETLWQELNNVRSRLLPINLFEKYFFFFRDIFFSPFLCGLLDQMQTLEQSLHVFSEIDNHLNCN